MSDISDVLPLVALIVAAISLFCGTDKAEVGPPGAKVKAGFCIGAIVVIAALWFAGRSLSADWAPVTGTLAGIVLGVLGAVSIEWYAPIGRFSKTLPIAFAAFDLTIAYFLGQFGPLGYVFGAVAAAWVLSMKHEAGLAARLAIAAGGIVACDMLGGLQATPVLHVGVYLALAVVIADLIAAPVGTFLAKSNKVLRLAAPVLLFALFSGAAYLLFRKLELSSTLSTLFVASAAVSLLVAWFTRGEEALSRVVMGAILWIAVATAAYGYDRGFGMSIALMAGIGTSIALNKPRALLCLGPLVAIVIYRVFWQLHPESDRGFDIGQHYALMGLLLGALTPILAGEWLRSEAASVRLAWLAAILWILLMAAAPVPVAIAFSDKGIVGYLIGLGLAPVLEATRRRSLDTLFISVGLASAMVLIYNWLEPHLELDRHQKIVALGWVVGLMAIAVLGIVYISRQRPSSEPK